MYPDSTNDILDAINQLNADIVAAIGAISLPDASETVKGIAEIATQAETDTGTDDTRIVTPLKLKNYSGFPAGAGIVFNQALVATFNPMDSVNYYMGAISIMQTTTGYHVYLYAPFTGTIKVINIWLYASGAQGTAESISAYVFVEAASTLIGSTAVASPVRQIVNTAMSVSVNQGDRIYLRLNCPAWATNPTDVWVSWVIYMES